MVDEFFHRLLRITGLTLQNVGAEEEAVHTQKIAPQVLEFARSSTGH